MLVCVHIVSMNISMHIGTLFRQEKVSILKKKKCYACLQFIQSLNCYTEKCLRYNFSKI